MTLLIMILFIIIMFVLLLVVLMCIYMPIVVRMSMYIGCDGDDDFDGYVMVLIVINIMW